MNKLKSACVRIPGGGREMVTDFELITQGLAFFITLATPWSARPLKMTNPLKFLLAGLLGFALADPAGIMRRMAKCGIFCICLKYYFKICLFCKLINRHMKTGIFSLTLSLFISFLACGQKISAWRPENRTGVSAEKGLLKSWPANGPVMLWSNIELGKGHSPLTPLSLPFLSYRLTSAIHSIILIF